VRIFQILIVFAFKICKQCLKLLQLPEDFQIPYRGFAPGQPRGDFGPQNPWAIDRNENSWHRQCLRWTKLGRTL